MQDICVFDFDGSVRSQSGLMQQYCDRIKVIDMHKHQHAARLWTSPRRFEHIRQEAFSGKQPFFSLLGSGDYHHFSLALINEHTEPLTVVLFDNHPDWMRPPHQYHCGTWVYQLARLPQVKRIVIVGLESGDINGKHFAAGDVESHANGKIALLPFRAVEAMIPGRGNVSLSSKLEQDLSAGIAEILSAISTDNVYVSVDKDCLRSEDACTNWEQGTLPLVVVIKCIEAIRGKHHVIGADTVGDYSQPKFWSPLKWIGSMLDRPANALRFRPTAAALRLNEVANIQLLQALDGNT
ncbi:MAG TPA: arginase family protein [Methylophilaceae bacterium]|jgi:hypothetical protein